LNKSLMIQTNNNTTNNLTSSILNSNNYQPNEQYITYFPLQPVTQQQNQSIYSYHPPHRFHQAYNNSTNNKRFKTYKKNLNKLDANTDSFHLMSANAPIDSTTAVLNPATNAASINYQPSFNNSYYYNYPNQTPSYICILDDQVRGAQTQASYIPADTTVIDPNINSYYYMMTAPTTIQAQPASQYQVLPSNISNSSNNSTNNNTSNKNNNNNYSKLKLSTYYGYPLNSY
jgi:hypothetical protein